MSGRPFQQPGLLAPASAEDEAISPRQSPEQRFDNQ
ncbi:MAG: hypothetical protein N838_03100 [Thiohalocapsa sp. PB-PSB1]|jgi:hypothetical protein|nr:MAG: hypothetical protein N838_03100 [Thiohalocapsa sp. PB-PSB1]